MTERVAGNRSGSYPIPCTPNTSFTTLLSVSAVTSRQSDMRGAPTRGALTPGVFTLRVPALRVLTLVLTLGAPSRGAPFGCTLRTPCMPLDVDAPPDRGMAVVASGLVRRFGGRKAVDSVSLELAPGECLALFGPNGAGKTTLLRLLGGQLKPSEGSVHLHGHQLPGQAATRHLIGLISHHTMVYAALTAHENVVFAAECHGLRNAGQSASDALALLKVRDRADTPVRLLSRGLQQRVSIARALVHNPRLVLLDEPYTGLDETGARALTRALEQLLSVGATLVLVTHHLGEGLALATRASIMMNGSIVRTDLTPPGGFDAATYATLYRSLTAQDGE